MHLSCGVPRLAALPNSRKEILMGINWLIVFFFSTYFCENYFAPFNLRALSSFFLIIKGIHLQAIH